MGGDVASFDGGVVAEDICRGALQHQGRVVFCVGAVGGGWFGSGVEQGDEAMGLGLVWCDGVVGCGDHDTHGWGVCFGLGDGVAVGEGVEIFFRKYL